jgi:two-component system, oxyanion-binding sensor
MSMEHLTIGFLPLVDAALPILARENGFAEVEGLDISLVRDVSWASVLDRLLYGHSDAAHMLAPLAVATTLGRGRPAKALAAPFVLGLNGNAITFSNALADVVQPGGALGDPYTVGARLKTEVAARQEAGRPVRFAVVHRYSSHNYKLRYWLAECGIHPDRDVEIVTIAPPFAADALADGEVDGICVGEPWNSVAVERGAGRIVLVTAQIWRRGVEKVLTMKADVLDGRRDTTERLVRALHAAAAHFVEPDNWAANAAILARAEYLDADAGLILRAISDRLPLAHGEAPTHIPDFMFQYREAANFPWRSQAAWLYTQMIRWEGGAFDADEAARAQDVFRPDVYRGALTGGPAPLPSASSKLEGAVHKTIQAGASQGDLALNSDVFFDHRAFDPTEMQSYLDKMPK